MNLRDRRLMDVHEVNLESGALKLVAENPGDVVGWDSTDDLEVKVAQAMKPDGSTEIRVRESPTAPWKTLLTAPFGESIAALDITADGAALLLTSSLNANTNRVIRKEIATGTETVIAENPNVDAGEVMIHPVKHVVQAVDFPAGRQAWTVIDPLVKADFEGIWKLRDGDFSVVNRDRDDKTWLVGFTEDRGPVRYYAWDRETKKGTFLFVHQPKLEGLPLAQMRAVSFPARDGLTLNGYLTLPVGVKAANLPLVLFVHGGPWARDTLGVQPVRAVARQPRLRRHAGELPRLHRLRQEVPERRQQAVGQGHAHRPARRGRLDGEAGLGRREEGRHHGRLLRRLLGARRRDLHARRLQVLGGHRGPVEPLHAARRASRPTGRP